MDDKLDEAMADGLEALNRLTALLAEETRLIATGQIEAGLALAAAKAKAADTVAGLSKRFKVMPRGQALSPQMEMLRQQLEAMQETLAVNLAVLATARSVSESLLRDVARRLSPASPNAYGPGLAKTRGAPLLISRAT